MISRRYLSLFMLLAILAGGSFVNAKTTKKPKTKKITLTEEELQEKIDTALKEDAQKRKAAKEAKKAKEAKDAEDAKLAAEESENKLKAISEKFKIPLELLKNITNQTYWNDMVDKYNAMMSNLVAENKIDTTNKELVNILTFSKNLNDVFFAFSTDTVSKEHTIFLGPGSWTDHFWPIKKYHNTLQYSNVNRIRGTSIPHLSDERASIFKVTHYPDLQFITQNGFKCGDVGGAIIIFSIEDKYLTAYKYKDGVLTEVYKKSIDEEIKLYEAKERLRGR